jgi:hypothetical protein
MYLSSGFISRDGVLKLGDFGVSLEFDGDNDLVRDTAGTVSFMAPEMCTSGDPFSARKTGMQGVLLFAQ